jgi:hypothetical protein
VRLSAAWATLTPGVVTVDTAGLVTAVGTGSGQIVATYGVVGAAAQIEVKSASLTLSIYEGDNQTAPPGSVVAVPPAVRVTDSQNAPKAGVPVTFAVVSGGGSVTGANATSDASGIARVGSWSLGASAGVNSLSASAAGATPVTFTATGARTSSDISLSVTAPTAGLVGDTVLIGALTISRYQLRDVTASIAAKSVSLVATEPGMWEGTISLLGEPRGIMILVVRATDIHDSVTEVALVLTHDRGPRVVITAPFDNSVARPTTFVDAACDDDDANGCTLSVLQGGSLIIGPTHSPLRATISLESSEGGIGILSIEARDSRDQVGTALRTLFVESSSHLQLLGAGHGTVRDFRDARLLLEHTSSLDTLALIQHVETGVTDTVRVSGTIQRTFLTPNGAVLSTSLSTAPYALLYVQRSGSLTSKPLNSSSSLAASGDWAIYTVGPLYRVNVITGVEDPVAYDAGNTENDVAENGDVAYWVPYNIVRYRAGTNTAITNDDRAVRWNTYPLTDGTNIVFRRSLPCCSDPWPMEIWLYDGTSLTVLASHTREVSPGPDYAVNAGWTAFTKPDLAGFRQVWTRSPTGVQRAVSAFGTSSTIRALAADGSVVFDNSRDRYLAGPSGSPIRISSTLGVVRWRDGRFVTMIGNSAFTVVP